MVPLVVAAVLGVLQPAAYAEFDPPGPDVWKANNGFTDPLCQVSEVFNASAYILPELGGPFDLIFPGGPHCFVFGTDDARLTGVITGGDPIVEFSVALDLTGAKPADPNTVEFLLREVCVPDGTGAWIQFTGISGELVGLPGTLYDGARYAITKRSNDAQLGFGASTHSAELGVFARINFELIDNPNAIPDLPVGPFAGEVSFNILRPGTCFPPAEPDLTGTWTGTIDCVGFDAEVGPAATPVENFFSAATLLIGRSTNELDVGDQYSVRLTRETGNAQSFCAYAPNNPDSTSGGQGVLVEPHRQATRVHFKFEGETLKARELIADGLHGTQLCKWSFTRASTTPPTVADACSPAGASGCFALGLPQDQCNDDALCGQGLACDGSSFTCTCKDGFVGDGTGIDVPNSTGCTPAP